MQQCDDPIVWRGWLDEIELPEGQTVETLAEVVAAVLKRRFDPALPDAQKIQQRQRAEDFWGLKPAWFERWFKTYGQLGDAHNKLLSWLNDGAVVDTRQVPSPKPTVRQAS